MPYMGTRTTKNLLKNIYHKNNSHILRLHKAGSPHPKITFFVDYLYHLCRKGHLYNRD